MSITKAPTRYYQKRMKCLLSFFLALNTALKALPNAHSKGLDPSERVGTHNTPHHHSVSLPFGFAVRRSLI